MPGEFAEWARTWRVKHPEWSYELWTDENLPPLVNRELFDAVGRRVPEPSRYRLQADLLRCELLVRFGGLYTDLDNECLRPVDDLMENQTFVVAMEPVIDDHIPNDFIAARINHPLLWDLIRVAPERGALLERKFLEGGAYAASRVDMAGGHQLAQLIETRRYSDVTVLPYQLIHPCRRWLDEGRLDYTGVAYVRNHLRPDLGWKS